VIDGVLAVAVADQVIVDPLSVPCAVPLTFKSPAHVALKLPFALVAVCSDAIHLKFVQEDGAGIMLLEADVHVPISALTLGVLVVGLVRLLECSKLAQPAAAAATASAYTRTRFFMAGVPMFAGVPEVVGDLYYTYRTNGAALHL
jgi:hypothetical protein